MDPQIIPMLTRIERKLEEHDGRFQHIDQRFEHIDQRFEHIDHRLDTHGGRLNAHDERFDGIDRVLAHHTDLHEQHSRDIADINVFMMKEFNRVYARMDGLESVILVAIESLRSDFRAFRDELSEQRQTVNDHGQRIERLGHVRE